jgi:protein-export membrane protein SecD
MSEGWKWKFSGTFLALILALYLLVPSFFDFGNRLDAASEGGETFSRVSQFFPQKAINLGLDLRGGMYLEMLVDLEGALDKRLDIVLAQMERLVGKGNFPNLKLFKIKGMRSIRVTVGVAKKREFLEFLSENFGRSLELKDDSDNFIIGFRGDYEDFLRGQTLKQAEEAVRNRIDRFGVVEVAIQTQGDDRLIIEMPGLSNPNRVIDVIRQTGQLEFKLVDKRFDAAQLSALIREVREGQQLSEGYGRDAVKKLNEALQDKIPAESEVVYEVSRDRVTKKVTGGIPYLVFSRARVMGDMLKDAQVGIQDNQPFVSLSLNKLGAKNFGAVTKENVGERLAILLDNTLVSAPVVQEPILNGEARITLGFGNYQTLIREAEDLALVLREGALPARLTIATKTVIGPSLGLDSIRKGLQSLLIASLVVILFMMVYYRWGGVLTTFALIINVIFIFAILALFQASLTLPGMAGIVLTLGMAVDANIIIFERMKEEKRLGKTAKSVVESGYANAMSAIMDANITTLIAGVVLYQFGTGPIKGFATTLMIGIATTLFTALVVTRLVYDYFLIKRKMRVVSV